MQNKHFELYAPVKPGVVYFKTSKDPLLFIGVGSENQALKMEFAWYSYWQVSVVAKARAFNRYPLGVNMEPKKGLLSYSF